MQLRLLPHHVLMSNAARHHRMLQLRTAAILNTEPNKRFSAFEYIERLGASTTRMGYYYGSNCAVYRVKLVGGEEEFCIKVINILFKQNILKKQT